MHCMVRCQHNLYIWFVVTPCVYLLARESLFFGELSCFYSTTANVFSFFYWHKIFYHKFSTIWYGSPISPFSKSAVCPDLIPILSTTVTRLEWGQVWLVRVYGLWIVRVKLTNWRGLEVEYCHALRVESRGMSLDKRSMNFIFSDCPRTSLKRDQVCIDPLIPLSFTKLSSKFTWVYNKFF